MTQSLSSIKEKVISGSNSIKICDAEGAKRERKRSENVLDCEVKPDTEQLIANQQPVETGSSKAQQKKDHQTPLVLSKDEEKMELNDDDIWSRIAKIQLNLSRNFSNASKEKIMNILSQVLELTDVEKFLLYLQLPTGLGGSSNLLSRNNTKVEYIHAISWISSHYEEDQGTSLLKSQMYEDYKAYCDREHFKPLKFGDFNRMTREVYPSAKPRRLGVRGQSKYCLSGIKSRCHLPDVELPALEQFSTSYTPKQDADDDCIEELIGEEVSQAAASSLICEWAQKLFSQNFSSSQQLAQYLVKNGYVNSVSLEAFTVQAISDTSPPLTTEDDQHGFQSTASSKDSETEPPMDQRRATQLKLQRKIQERALLSQQKKLMEKQRNQTNALALHNDHGTSKEELTAVKSSKSGASPHDKDTEVKALKKVTNITPTKMILPKSTANMGHLQGINKFSPDVAGLMALPSSQGLKGSNNQQPVFVIANQTNPNTPAPPIMILSPVSAQGVVSASAQSPVIQRHQQVIPPNMPALPQAQKSTSKPSNKTQKLPLPSSSSAVNTVPASPLVSLANLAPKLNISAPLVCNPSQKSAALLSVTPSTQVVVAQSPLSSSNMLTSMKTAVQINQGLPRRNEALHQGSFNIKSREEQKTVAHKPDRFVSPDQDVLKQEHGNNTEKRLRMSHFLSGSSKTAVTASFHNVTESGEQKINELGEDTSAVLQKDTQQAVLTLGNTLPSTSTLACAVTCSAEHMSTVNAAVANYEKMLSARNSPASTKPRLIAKTVSDLLKEQRGVEPGDKRCFVNDSRPVAQILKETRQRQMHLQNVLANSPQYLNTAVLGSSPTGCPRPVMLKEVSVRHNAQLSAIPRSETPNVEGESSEINTVQTGLTSYSACAPKTTASSLAVTNLSTAATNGSLSSLTSVKNSPKLRDLLNAKDDMPRQRQKRNTVKPDGTSSTSLNHMMTKYPSLHKDLKACIFAQNAQEGKNQRSPMPLPQSDQTDGKPNLPNDMEVDVNYEVEKLLLSQPQQQTENLARVAMKRAASEPPYRHSNKCLVLDGTSYLDQEDFEQSDATANNNQTAKCHDAVFPGQRIPNQSLDYQLTDTDQSVLPDLGDIAPSIDMMVASELCKDSDNVQNQNFAITGSGACSQRRMSASCVKSPQNRTIHQLLLDRLIANAPNVLQHEQNASLKESVSLAFSSVPPTSEAGGMGADLGGWPKPMATRSESQVETGSITTQGGKSGLSFMPIQSSSVVSSFSKPTDACASLINSQSSSNFLHQTLQSTQPSVPMVSMQQGSVNVQSTMPLVSEGAKFVGQPFAPVSTIRPVKRGKGPNVGAGVKKRMRHHSAQDSFLLKASLRAAAKPPMSPLSQSENSLSVESTCLAEESGYVSVTTMSQVPHPGTMKPIPSPFSPEIHDIFLGEQFGDSSVGLQNAHRSHSVPAHYMINRNIHQLESCESQIVQCADADISNDPPATESHLRGLLQDKLLASAQVSYSRGIQALSSSQSDQQLLARKNLSNVLGEAQQTPPGLIGTSRGDHLISGAPFRPPLKYALSMPRNSDDLVNQGAMGQLQRVCHNSSYVIPNAVPTPPSSENTTPDFSDEVPSKIDSEAGCYTMTGTIDVNTGKSMSGSDLDTPSSLGVVSDADPITDHLLQSVCGEDPEGHVDLMEAPSIVSFNWE